MLSRILLPPDFASGYWKWLSPLLALAMMLVAALCIWQLDQLRIDTKPELLSKRLEVRRQIAMDELAHIISERKAAYESSLELKRQETDAWLEFADVKSDPDREKPAGGAKKTPALPESEREKLFREKLDRLDKAKVAINKLHVSLTPDIDAVIAHIDKLDEDAPKESEKPPALAKLHNAAMTSEKKQDSGNANPPPKHGFVETFVDEKSSIYYLYKAIIIGLVVAFSYCGLYLMYTLAKCMKISVEGGKSFGEIFSALKEKGTLPALAVGAATLVGAASVGAALAGNGGGGGNTVRHAEIVAPQASNQKNINNQQDNRIWRGDEHVTMPSPLTVKLDEPIPLSPVKLEPGAAWETYASSLKSATDNLVTETRQLKQSSETLSAAATVFSNTMSGIKWSTEMDLKAIQDALKKITTSHQQTTEDLNALAKRALQADCNIRRAVSITSKGNVHTLYGEYIAPYFKEDEPCPSEGYRK
ncbi:hypothetical protein GCM10027277_39370 [Pseudoduganella ginsengisoli]|uniref:Uncharacterized protein n=1 Tax=Pseudoduganella ginsengisoli TaxID=1462440 RepID=A0A6L6PWN5_9BURK|nr:hypothetical protein [Pseudoduganella ginsengisoli]MTW01993.1 hypothetical protein [Pseudoduganella ginsengisoli]